MISHNGEINTLRGNINWMRAREALFASELYEPGDVAKIKPIIREGLSDTACLDNAVELLVRSGYSLPHAMMMLIPEAWENHETMSQVKKDFYQLPQLPDGALGRPGLGRLHRRQEHRRRARPQRPAAQPLRRHEGRPGDHGLGGRAPWRSRPRDRAQEGPARAGQDVPGRPRAGPDRRRRGAQAPDRLGQALRQVAPRAHGARWPTCPPAPDVPGPDPRTLLQRQQAFGYTLEDLKFILGPMGDERRGGDRLDGQRHARWPCSPTAPSRSSTTSSSSSPR